MDSVDHTVGPAPDRPLYTPLPSSSPCKLWPRRCPPVPEGQPLGPSAADGGSACCAQGLFLASASCQQGATWEVGAQI